MLGQAGSDRRATRRARTASSGSTEITPTVLPSRRSVRDQRRRSASTCRRRADRSSRSSARGRRAGRAARISGSPATRLAARDRTGERALLAARANSAQQIVHRTRSFAEDAARPSANPAPMDSRGYYRTPTIAGETIVFVCEDDLWSVRRRGGLARRLTAGPGTVFLAAAFTRRRDDRLRRTRRGQRRRSTRLPAAGGPPRRLTFLGQRRALRERLVARRQRDLLHLRRGRAVRQGNASPSRSAATADRPRRLPVGHAMSLDVAADGATLLGRNNIDPARWKRYRGGTAGHLWVDATGSGTFARIGCATSTATWSGRCGTANASRSSPITKASATSIRRAPDGSDVRRLTDEREYFARYPVDRRQRASSYACGGEIVVLDPGESRAAPSPDRNAVGRAADRAPLRRCRRFARIVRARRPTGSRWRSSRAATRTRCRCGKRRSANTARATDARRRDDRLAARRHARRRTSTTPPASSASPSQPVDQSAPPAYVTADRSSAASPSSIASPCRRPARVRQSPPRALRARPRRANRASSTRAKPGAASISRSRPTAAGWPTRGRRNPARRSSASPIATAARVIDATEALREDRAPAWDPDGKYLYFISARDFNPIYDALQFDLELSARDAAVRGHAARATFPTRSSPLPAPLHRSQRRRRRRRRTRTTTERGDDKTPKPPAPVLIDTAGLPQRILAFPVEEGNYERVAGVKGRARLLALPGARHPAVAPRRRRRGRHAASPTTSSPQRTATLADRHRRLRARRRRPHAGLRIARQAARHRRRRRTCPREEPEAKAPTETNRRSGWLDLGRVGVLVEPRRRMGADAARGVAVAARAVLGPADVGRRLGRRC